MSDEITLLDNHNIGNFHYSAAKIGDLGATEYTLATIVFDESGSTDKFQALMNKCAQEIVKACRRSPRVDNLMLRVLCFGSQVREFHGFKLLQNCNVDDYENLYQPNGMTALNDATHDGFAVTNDFAKKLSQSHYSVNGVVFVVTDGDNNNSSLQEHHVREELVKSVQSESLESLTTILVGVNIQDPRIKQCLEDFGRNVGFTQQVMLDNATEKTLAKLAQFVSKSITSVSSSIGTGQPPVQQSLTF